jgi:RNA polymerase sigma-70 factor (sigma-E family)
VVTVTMIVSFGAALAGPRAEPGLALAPASPAAASMMGAMAEGAGVEVLTFEQLYAQQARSMARLAYLMTGSAAQAEEVVHDAFAQVYERWGRIDNPPAYLRTCVVNGSRRLLRRRRMERDRVRPPVGEESFEREYLHDALAALPTKRRAALVLRYFADLSEAEIASSLGVRPGTVKSMLHRGLAELKGMLEP